MSGGGGMSGAEYLQRVLGDTLAKALSAVAKERPDDPVQYVADYLYKARKEQQQMTFDVSVEDRDSGLYDDQEAPMSNDTTTTIDIREREAEGRNRLSPEAGGMPGAAAYAHRDSASYDRSKSRERGRRSRDGSRNSRRRNGGGGGTASTSSSGQSEKTTGTGGSERRGRPRSRRRRRGTAQSEPVNSVTSSSSLTYVRRDDPSVARRSHSVNPKDQGRSSTYDKRDPRRIVSKRVPMAALSNDEYRKQRGLHKLPPMESAPRVEREMEGLTYSINGKTKPRQLQPLLDGWQDTFDWKKHDRKNKKILRETKIMANMV